MQWLIDTIVDVCKSKIGYVDRGDAASWDYVVGDFTFDWTWRPLDLSSIVPAEARAVVIVVAFEASSYNRSFVLRRFGNLNVFNRLSCNVIYPYRVHEVSGIVPFDSSGFVEYRGSAGGFTVCSFLVRGWFL